MFTGIIAALGTVTSVTPHGDGVRLRVSAPGFFSDVYQGDSVAVSGVCLTAIDPAADEFAADVMAQTLKLTSLGELESGSRVNLEKALTASDRLGGHIVQGHVEAIGRVLEVRPGDQWRVLRIELPKELAPLVVDQGSITVSGVSLTVSAVSEAGEPNAWFEVSLIPETLEVTTLGELGTGDVVNLESDILARHVQRMLAFNALPQDLTGSQLKEEVAS